MVLLPNTVRGRTFLGNRTLVPGAGWREAVRRRVPPRAADPAQAATAAIAATAKAGLAVWHAWTIFRRSCAPAGACGTHDWTWVPGSRHARSKVEQGPVGGARGCDETHDAYYLKYRNRRPDYLDAWWKVVAWDVVDERLRDVVAETSPF